MKKILAIIVIGVIIISTSGVYAISEHEQKSSLNSSINDLYDMVIISPDIFSSSLQPLIDHKNSRNVQTVLKTTEEIYNENLVETERYNVDGGLETYEILNRLTKDKKWIAVDDVIYYLEKLDCKVYVDNMIDYLKGLTK